MIFRRIDMMFLMGGEVCVLKVREISPLRYSIPPGEGGYTRSSYPFPFLINGDFFEGGGEGKNCSGRRVKSFSSCFSCQS